MTKHIFVTGGVVSSLGKGLTAASLALLLERRGYRVRLERASTICGSGVLVAYWRAAAPCTACRCRSQSCPAAFGSHGIVPFGKSGKDITWEKTDKANALRKAAAVRV